MIMGKRKSHAHDGENTRKKPRIAHEAPTSEEIHTTRQLRQLLAFDQDIRRARHGTADNSISRISHACLPLLQDCNRLIYFSTAFWMAEKNDQITSPFSESSSSPLNRCRCSLVATMRAMITQHISLRKWKRGVMLRKPRTRTSCLRLSW